MNPDSGPFGGGRTKVSVVQATVSKTGKQVGVQITGLTGNDSIENFKWYRHRDAGQPTCPIAYVPCTACQTVAASADELARWEGPLLMKFVSAGVGNGTSEECTKLNGIYILYAGQSTGYVVPDSSAQGANYRQSLPNRYNRTSEKWNRCGISHRLQLVARLCRKNQ